MVMKRFADDYETVVTIDEEGNEKKSAVYCGDYYELALDEEEILKFRKRSLLLLVVITALQIGAGFINNPGMYQFYIALPYVIAYFPLIYMAAGILRLPKEKRKYRRDELGLSFDRIKTTSRAILIFLIIIVLGEIIFILFLSADSQNLLEYLYLALEIIAAAAVYFLIRLQKQIRILPCNEPSQH